MKTGWKNAAFLLRYAWKHCRILYVTVSARYLFSACLPLINIAGLGVIVEALTAGQTQEQVVRVVLFYLLFNLSVAVLSELLAWIDSCAGRKASDVTQLEYMRDAVGIDYHHAQDGSILDLKRKSIGGHPVWFLGDVGVLLQYAVQLAGVSYLMTRISPLFVLLLLATSAVSIVLSFRTQRLEFAFQNARVPENRKLDYLYQAMTGYAFAKEIRINRANRFLEKKYESILPVKLKK